MSVTVGQLRAFAAVAETGSVNAAAQRLVVTQPSVSAALAALGRELGAPLVERAGRGIRLTAAGEAFAAYAEQVLGLLDEGRRAAVEAGAHAADQVRVVAVNTAGEYLLPPLIQAYRGVNPEAELLLEVGNRKTVLERLASHHADVGIGGRPPGGDIAGEVLLPNELVVVGRAAEDLTRATWLVREEGSGTRAATAGYIAAQGIEPRELLTLGSNGAVKQAVALGLGVTLVSAHAVARELRDGLLVRIPAPGTPIERAWYVLHRHTPPPRPAVRRLLDFLRSGDARDAVARAL